MKVEKLIIIKKYLSVLRPIIGSIKHKKIFKIFFSFKNDELPSKTLRLFMSYNKNISRKVITEYTLKSAQLYKILKIFFSNPRVNSISKYYFFIATLN